MAQLLVLIYGDEQKWADASDQWHRQNFERHTAFMAEAGGAVIGGNELEPTSAAISVRADPAGRPTATDGPFLETKEAIGGYYLLEAADLDEAIRLAARVLEASTSSCGVEIRPVKEMT